MHPALRKGPLFLQTPPFSTFVQKNPDYPLFTKKHPPFYFLLTGLYVVAEHKLVNLLRFE